MIGAYNADKAMIAAEDDEKAMITDQRAAAVRRLGA